MHCCHTTTTGHIQPTRGNQACIEVLPSGPAQAQARRVSPRQAACAVRFRALQGLAPSGGAPLHTSHPAQPSDQDQAIAAMSVQQQQQQLQARPAPLHQQHQQQPWWANPLHGIGSALQGMQHNLQQLANNLPKPPGQNQNQTQRAPSTYIGAAPQSVTMSSSSSSTLAPFQGHVSQQAVPSLAQQPAAAAAAAAAGGAARGRGKQQQVQAVTKEELGRATWVFLHTLAAQFPERPTRQQQRDARQLVDSLTRIYPCADCAQHFQEIVRYGFW